MDSSGAFRGGSLSDRLRTGASRVSASTRPSEEVGLKEAPCIRIFSLLLAARHGSFTGHLWTAESETAAAVIPLRRERSRSVFIISLALWLMR